jgi:hypothetical protein
VKRGGQLQHAAVFQRHAAIPALAESWSNGRTRAAVRPGPRYSHRGPTFFLAGIPSQGASFHVPSRRRPLFAVYPPHQARGGVHFRDRTVASRRQACPSR